MIQYRGHPDSPHRGAAVRGEASPAGGFGVESHGVAPIRRARKQGVRVMSSSRGAKVLAWATIVAMALSVVILGPSRIFEFLYVGLQALLVRKFGVPPYAAEMLRYVAWLAAGFLVLAPFLMIAPAPAPRPHCSHCPHCGQHEYPEKVLRCDACGALYCERCALAQSSTLGWYEACPTCERTGSRWVANVGAGPRRT